MAKKHNKVGNKRNVILDTNIIQYLGTDGLKDRVIDCLREAVQAQYDLAISDVTIFELLHTAPLNKEIEMVSTFNGLKRFYVTKKVFIAAAHLASLYNEAGFQLGQIDFGDKIIAGTSVLTNSVIFTANTRDFPAPFFKEIARRNLQYKKQNHDLMMSTSFLEPDIEFIVHQHNARMGVAPQTAVTNGIHRS